MAQSSTQLSWLANQPYMNSSQLLFFRDRLLAWRKRMNANLVAATLADGSTAETSPDWIDAASAQTQAELIQVNRERVVAMTREIDAALERIRDGRYGYCIETGEEIGLRRLLAMPTAQFTVVVQEQQEQRKRHNR